MIRSLALVLLLSAPAALAQGTGIQFGSLQQDTSLPVEVQADELQVDQTDGNAIFTGNVRVTQGELILTAANLRVNYAQEGTGAGGGISSLFATGGVTLVNGTEAAEASEANYDIDAGRVVMRGDVLLTQGQTALSGDQLDIDLNTGSGQMRGNVRSIFQPEAQ